MLLCHRLERRGRNVSNRLVDRPLSWLVSPGALRHVLTTWTFIAIAPSPEDDTQSPAGSPPSNMVIPNDRNGQRIYFPLMFRMSSSLHIYSSLLLQALI